MHKAEEIKVNDDYGVMKHLLNLIAKKEITSEEVDDILLNNVDCVDIYSSDDTLLTDLYFTIKHFALGEEEITEEEIVYFKQCIDGNIIHSFKGKDEFICNYRRA